MSNNRNCAKLSEKLNIDTATLIALHKKYGVFVFMEIADYITQTFAHIVGY